MDFDQRLARLLKSLAGEQLERFSQMLDEGLNAWERRLGLDEEAGRAERPDEGFEEARFGSSARTGQESARPSASQEFDDAFLRDLAAFGLTPPTTLAALKKARKEELKKYHPDRFHRDPKKAEAAHRIVQILGETYERLLEHRHFKSQTKK